MYVSMQMTTALLILDVQTFFSHLFGGGGGGGGDFLRQSCYPCFLKSFALFCFLFC